MCSGVLFSQGLATQCKKIVIYSNQATLFDWSIFDWSISDAHVYSVDGYGSGQESDQSVAMRPHTHQAIIHCILIPFYHKQH